MSEQTEKSLSPFMSQLGAWAFSLGTAIGWGSLVVTSNTYLLQAGPAGSIIGLLIGAAVMVAIARNYHYMLNRFPDSGGAYTYARQVFGYDHAFLIAWFLGLTYIAVFLANVTSLPLFSRYFLGSAFQFGFHYEVFGYTVYLGEALLSIAAIVLVSLISIRSRKGIMYGMIALAFVFTLGILVVFAAALFGFDAGTQSLEPAFVPDKNVITQVALIACISPWAFIGFENVSHFAEEFTFSHTKIFKVMLSAVIVSTVLYGCLLILSTMAYPPQYSNWFEYIGDLGNLEGIMGLPPFYVAYRYMGDAGVGVLMMVLLALVITSLFANLAALARLFRAMAKDSVIPARFAKINDWHIPSWAILLVAAISVLVPFLGRTAIGWIVDVTTIGASIVYGFVSAATIRVAKENKDKTERATGIIGLVSMVVFCLYILLPSLFLSGSLATESYFLFTAWGIVGFIFFRSILSRDTQHRFGRSIVVWIGLLSLVVFFSFVWMSQSLAATADGIRDIINAYYTGEGATGIRLQDQDFVLEQVAAAERSNLVAVLIVAISSAIALIMLITNITFIANSAKKSERELDFTRGIVYTDTLTGVKNRPAYLQMEESIDERVAEGSLSEFAVVVCDLNGLKDVNDTKGHSVGDEYIRSASKVICDTFKHSPVFRVGGDEFVVVLTGRDYEAASELVARLTQLSTENVGTDDVVIAAGISHYSPKKDSGIRTVFERADARMYINKRELKGLQKDSASAPTA